ncbi:hypothetical protein [Flammeovirga agarivorans]|uniref:Uncharacterized protein n=1 Tax=Flammeovirga agarivorans TaxID=2726742 RepID=A0A7X8XVT6_9BACT|nr:hypothetical protein [Flammeovirga agarivorans]NLR91579.1 hypothetical protein [Flammeovirga agarivorans]
MKKIIIISLLLFSSFIAQAQLVIVVQAVASSIKAPNQLDNVTFYVDGDSVVVPVTKLKKQKVADYDSIKVSTLMAADKVHKVYGDSVAMSEVPEDALFYENTKRYRKARMSTLFAASSWTLTLLNPYFLIVAPLPTIQALKRDKTVDKAYVMSGKEWREHRGEYKAYRKQFNKKNMKDREEEETSFSEEAIVKK